MHNMIQLIYNKLVKGAILNLQECKIGVLNEKRCKIRGNNILKLHSLPPKVNTTSFIFAEYNVYKILYFYYYIINTSFTIFRV